MRNWAMCKKVLAKSHFFLKYEWIHFLGFLLIPRYNHDRIIREFRRPRRRTGILCFCDGRIRLDCGKEVNRVDLCLLANNCVIDHATNRVIDQNKKPTTVSLAGVMRKGENEVGLLRFYKNVKYCILEAMHMRRLNCSMTFWFSLRPHCI